MGCLEYQICSRGRVCGQPGNHGFYGMTNPCRGRFYCARRRVSEANRTAGPALRPEISARFAAAQTPPGGYGIRPYGQRQTPRPNGKTRHRKAPREGHGPPLQTFRNAPPNRNGCDHPGDRRAGCPHPAAPRGAANVPGRIWNPPLRINFMFWPTRDGHSHPVDRRAGCPHPAAPRGAANVRGRIWNPPLRINFMFWPPGAAITTRGGHIPTLYLPPSQIPHSKFLISPKTKIPAPRELAFRVAGIVMLFRLARASRC